MAKSLYDSSGLGNLDPDDYNQFQTQRRQARSNYNRSTAQNKFRRTGAGVDYADAIGDLRRQYTRARGSFGSDFIQRGLLNSGLYRQGYADLQRQRQDAQADLRRQYQRTLDGLGLADRQLLGIRDDALNDIESAQAARRASVAAALRYAREH